MTEDENAIERQTYMDWNREKDKVYTGMEDAEKNDKEECAMMIGDGLIVREIDPMWMFPASTKDDSADAEDNLMEGGFYDEVLLKYERKMEKLENDRDGFIAARRKELQDNLQDIQGYLRKAGLTYTSSTGEVVPAPEDMVSSMREEFANGLTEEALADAYAEELESTKQRIERVKRANRVFFRNNMYTATVSGVDEKAVYISDRRFAIPLSEFGRCVPKQGDRLAVCQVGICVYLMLVSAGVRMEKDSCFPAYGVKVGYIDDCAPVRGSGDEFIDGFIPFALLGTADRSVIEKIHEMDVFFINGRPYPAPSTLAKIAWLMDSRSEHEALLAEIAELREIVAGLKKDEAEEDK